jgi:transposase-like protein
MKFGIVVCPRCKNAKAVDLSYKTTKCHRCGKILSLEKLRIWYKSDSNQKIRQVLGLVNAKMDSKFEEFKELMRK